MSLPPFRQEAPFAEAPSEGGLSIVEASAGTGKTFAISHLVPRLLLDGTISRLNEILLVTYTNDAARELSDRVRQVLAALVSPPVADEADRAPGIHALRRDFAEPAHRHLVAKALLEIDSLNVSTIHSFCQRVLQTEGPLCGHPAMPELVPDSAELCEEIVHDLWVRRIAADPFRASLAAGLHWTPQDDLEVLRMTDGLDAFLPEPQTAPFDEISQRIREGPGRFEPDVLSELRAFEASVEGWNKVSSDPELRAAHIEELAICSDIRRWLEALQWVDSLRLSRGGAIPGRGKANQEIINRAGDLRAVTVARDLLVAMDHAHWSWRLGCAAESALLVRDSLRRDRLITYDGLLRAVHDALRSPATGALLAERLREQFRIGIIDESQDTDRRQFEIFSSIFLPAEADGHRLVLVGDPKQAIYEFRGADVNTYLEARRAAGAHVSTLATTYRSPAALVGAVNALFARPGTFLKEGLTFFPSKSGVAGDVRLDDAVGGDARIEVWLVPEEQAREYSQRERRLARVSAMVATEIARLLRSGGGIERVADGGGPRTKEGIGPGDFAVLVNSHREAAAVFEALRVRGIPSIRARTADVFASEEAADLLALLRALEDPRRGKMRTAALATRLLGFAVEDIAGVREDPAADDREMDAFVRWSAIFEQRGAAVALAAVDAERGLTVRLASQQEGERRVTNFRQLCDLLEAASVEGDRHPSTAVRWLAHRVAAASERAQVEEHQQQLESDASAVQIVTMHSAKGLEYNFVFCPFLWASSTRRRASIKKLSRQGEPPQIVCEKLLDGESQSFKGLRRAAMEDRLRLAYVALTRARVKTWICAGACAANAEASALDWILRPEAEADFEEWISQVKSRSRFADHAAGLEDILGHSPEARAWLAVQDPPVPDLLQGSTSSLPAAKDFLARPVPFIPPAWGVTSFSALTREKNAKGGGSFREVPGGTRRQSPVPNAFFDAPGGARVGTAMHEWLETWDFGALDEEALERHFRGHSLPPLADGSSFAAASANMLTQLRGAVLPGLVCPVARACADPAASEWHFHLPIRSEFSADSLADAFARFGDIDSAPYAADLRALPMPELFGFLQGFMDRLACHDGQWGVIDWKTNVLGPSVEDYSREGLLAAARQGHYLLQAHLYLVALRRYLGTIPQAGAWLVFLRAVRAETSQGVLHIQPQEQLLHALDALFR